MLTVFTSLPVFGSIITVTNTSDSGAGSLRAAIAAASPGDTINFGVTGTITLGSTLTVGTNLTINGPGASNLAINGNKSVGVFVINSGITATISGVTIENGSAPNGGGVYNSGNLSVSNSTLSSNSATYDAGCGIWNSGVLTVSNSTFSGNSGPQVLGGGIFNIGGTASVRNSTFSGNSAGVGGGIFNLGGTVTVSSSTLSGNSATPFGSGGGIFSTNGGTVIVTNSTLSGNSATYYGGGIYNQDGPLTVTNSSLSGNSAGFNGGGIQSYIQTSGVVTVTNSTLSGNSAGAGGGIYNPLGPLAVTNSTLSGNSAVAGGGIYNLGTLTSKNSIVANSGPAGNCLGTIASQGHNLSDDTTCSSFFNQTGDLNSTPAGLDKSGLQNNGGPTKTVALLAGSPAIDAGDGAICAAPPVNNLDQRGFVRPAGAHCDIGAYEFNAVPPDTVGPVTSGVSVTPNLLAVNTGSSLAATVSDATTGGSTVASAYYSINGGAPSQMSLTPSTAVTTQASASLAPFSLSNVYNVCVHGTDVLGNIGADACILLPVYDPSGSFVNGGGQVASPSGADLRNTSAAGLATFGFVSKYLPGMNIPSGNLEFQFKEGNLNFKSTSMDWLVVTGEPRAKFHGTGTVNGTNVCNFEVDAWAGSFTGNVDAFGLKISSCSSGGDRYSLPATALTKGSIIIHK